MAFDITNFIAELQQNGTLTNSHFDVTINTPPILLSLTPGVVSGGSSSFASLTPTMNMRCEDVEIPGVGIRTGFINRYGVGNITKYPTAAGYTDITLQFLCDSESQIHFFWYSWMNMVSNFVNPQSFFNISTRQYTLNYKDDYVADLQVNKYDESGKVAYTCYISRAWPVAINATKLSWRDNSKTKITVSLTYDEWYIDNFSVSTS